MVIMVKTPAIRFDSMIRVRKEGVDIYIAGTGCGKGLWASSGRGKEKTGRFAIRAEKAECECCVITSRRNQVFQTKRPNLHESISNRILDGVKYGPLKNCSVSDGFENSLSREKKL
jgi:hypothetical protein